MLYTAGSCGRSAVTTVGVLGTLEFEAQVAVDIAILRRSVYSAVHSRHSTKREIEIKLRIANPGDIVRRLRSLGATSRGRVLERNTLFDTPDSALRRHGCLLRLRIETPEPSDLVRAGKACARLTSKSPVSRGSRRTSKLRYKEKLEREFEVKSPRLWTARLRSLGFRPGFRYEKYRSSFVLPGLHLDLDETPTGVFLELEGAPASIDRAAKALGFSSRDYLCGTYWEIYAADCARRGIKPGNFVFRT